MLTIIYGILGLSLIVLVHETGHFIAARLCGVKVESFSIGMGPILFHKTIKDTDYRISLIPLGGYCGMKGEQSFSEAIEQNLPAIEGESDSFYGVHPFKRAIISFCGPFFNVIFAFIAFVIISLVGYDYYTTSNRIILSTDVYPEMTSPAAVAGLQTGDYIVKINNTEVSYFYDISRYISLHADEDVTLTVLRNGNEHTFTLHTELDKSSGAGKIGVINWVDPIVADVSKDSNAYEIGFTPYSTITKIDGIPVFNTSDIQKLIDGKDSVFIEWETEIERKSGVLSLTDGNIGLSFKTLQIHTPKLNIFQAIWAGLKETGSTIGTIFKSFELLFKGIDFTQAVSGPVRITKMLGDTAVSGFSSGFAVGIVVVLNFLALISLSLFIMNLLPIPILDGGLILFALIETVFKTKIKPKFMYYVQFVGIALIGILFVIALYGDLMYLFKK